LTDTLNTAPSPHPPDPSNPPTLLFAPGYGITVTNATNVTLTALTIDFSPACYAQGTVLSATAAYMHVHLDAGSPKPDPAVNPFFSYSNEVKAIFWDPQSRTIRRGNQPMYTGASAAALLPDGTYNISLRNGNTYRPQAGDLVTISPRVGSNINAAVPTDYWGTVTVSNSSACRFENLLLYGAGAMAVLEWGGAGGHVYRNITLTRKPGRLLSSNVDAFHSFAVANGPLVEGCTFEHMGDDFVNLHNRVSILLNVTTMQTEVGGASTAPAAEIIDTGDIQLCDPVCRATHTTPHMRAGDAIGVYSITAVPTLQFNMTVAGAPRRVDDDPAVRARALAALAALSQKPYSQQLVSISSTTLAVYRVPLTAASIAQLDLMSLWGVRNNGQDGALPQIHSGSTSSSEAMDAPPLYWTQLDAQSSAGGVVRNCTFRDSYDNTMRLQASHTLIEDTLFDGAGAGVGVVFDAGFLEGTLGIHNVTLRNNIFRGVRGCTNASTCVHVGPTARDVTLSGNVYEPAVQTQTGEVTVRAGAANGAAPPRLRWADVSNGSRPLVGIHYFAGWW
jgi:hypothetical protein